MAEKSDTSWTRRGRDLDPVDLRADQPHSARIHDYFLGGKDNFPADRDAAERVLEAFPNVRITARANRAFMARAVRYLASEAGIHQFIDLGTGIPTSPNLHEIAQRVAPDARVVYADNDPIVLTHARALLASGAAGRTAYLNADVRDLDTILTAAELHDTLNLSRPVAVSLIAIMHFIPDEQDAYGLVRRLVGALPAGSYLTLTHGTADFDPVGGRQAWWAYAAGDIASRARCRAEVERFFAGLELVEPGVQVVHRWRPDAEAEDGLTDAEVAIYGGVGRKD
ncbi:SAM-dependent methyltransferase [Frankia sp. AgB32]|uniref:SAM-dependent methyltransferase n=1 Tax=Frankia sp. AgB32 TaxID=631119 RepID=UPI00200C5699|nr:SAM-dependent methyltransferase [Frankia sp. AgB32]MCK9897030.1 SAM-dependent methyltransferase [Frankia sp. AgB32]